MEMLTRKDVHWRITKTPKRGVTLLILLQLKFYHRGRYLNDSIENLCKPRWPQHTYYYIVVIIVAGKKMQEREMKYTFNC